ncbi:YjjG family noncanonical pyrimidine nucleotidase [Companilactobacillus sp.]|jgi:YjjG family noncanonical pyrimidine nucleotidase|uniref:YjjG family noncanonical pyrimidine nucleotidase n=1 Tax=Companilactobacillus sp. TaxID=2767905 RepID=UPI0025C29287|nr:YjjG family noncanonical pyrimidine nucleotidase [Companilactobacillus sp.]MCH4009747.1 YjjG family noncanonical pyrimidine nucleotidase [Companilactobacillus sp.]MCH4052577.1 YjjG family noncanonical pyrimidine nucleotidase [Companilactobacillus sp.]MCH4077689.1 YjjG family noncanonical pyrimidine nucleotidase [Companilactobacillus sp.]MCH4126265.1 YjjG family noncanonical pyrimidine nucleotidase [Companilactobacillus sp.]MCI1311973.1 YjjG family noncanonical pyrimidine nucleotidase [Compa
MKYPIILFDLDSTLLDTEKNAEKALHEMSIASSFAFDDSQIAYWHVLNNNLWQQFEDKQITRQELLDQRFARYFEHFGIDVDTSDFQDEYIQLFANEHELIPHAKELLADLDSDHRMFVISNGTKFKQHAQISGAGIGDYFEKVILSEDIGFQKPDIRFFEEMEKQIPNANRSDMLIVGDSLTADIAGAVEANIDSVWFNPQNSQNKTNFEPTYEVDNLLKIESILNK